MRITIKRIFTPGQKLEFNAAGMRQYYFKTDSEHALQIIIIGAAIVLLLAFIDYLFYKLSLGFWLFLLLRLAFFGATLIFFQTIRKLDDIQGPEILDRLMLAWNLALGLVILMVDFFRPPSYTQNQSLYILTIFAIYTVSSTRFYSRFIPAVLLSLGDLVIVLFLKDPITFQALNMTIALTTISHIMGLIISGRTDNYRIQQYLTKKNEEQTLHELEQLATTDDLTGLNNRRRFMEMLDLELKRFQRSQTNFCLMAIDFDNFKDINDQFGHPVGDEVLVEFSRLLKEDSRAGDVLGRLGGDEFTILCPVTSLADARILAERISSLCPQIRCIFKHFTPNITISMGITEVHADDELFPDALMKRADTALYLAKQNGRNRIEVI